MAKFSCINSRSLIKLLISLAIFTIFELRISNGQIIFVKTMDGERFKEDTIPSLTRSVSYVLASNGVRNITYTMNSKYFAIDQESGRVYLISRFEKSLSNLLTTHIFQITATDGIQSSIISNTITIVDSNDNAPYLISNEQVFQVAEDMFYPMDITFSNGSTVLIKFYDLDPSNNLIDVSCQNLFNFIDACSRFRFVKRVDLSSNRYWIGTIRLINELNYVARSIYQIVAVVKDDAGNTNNVTFIIKVLPSLSKPPQISSDCIAFAVEEQKPIGYLVGRFSLINSYEYIFGEFTTYSIVKNRQEILNYQSFINDPELTQTNIDISNKYFQIINNNKLIIQQVIDRDSYELSSINSVIKIWIKVSYNLSSSFSYQKVSVIIIDINDNSPKFGQYFLKSLDSYNLVSINQQLIAVVNENEVGALYFNNIANSPLVAYDLDLGENASFVIQIASSTNLPVQDLISYFTFGDTTQNIGVIQSYIQSSCSLNIANKQAFDFEALNIYPVENVITPGVAVKSLQFSLVAKEILSAERYQSDPMQLLVYVQDVNDNKPYFEQSFYEINVDSNTNNGSYDIELLTFKVIDRDMGVYGVKGLVCRLLGDGSDKFRVSSSLQKLYLTACLQPPCLDITSKPVYELLLVCTDNNGQGYSTYSSIKINVQGVVQKSFKIFDKLYYLLATGPSKTEIPTLKFKPLVYNITNRITYTITDNYLANLFYVDNFGVFKIITNSLSSNQSTYANGTFKIDIKLTDSYGYSDQVTVILQIETQQSLNRCPKISSSAQCSFTINDLFDKDTIRFCFYGANPTATDDDNVSGSDPRLSQIVYSLSSDSPYYIDINSYDGCVKIAPAYILDYSVVKIIKYSVGVMNPGFPECLSSSLIDCSITITKVLNKPPRCDSTLKISANASYAKVVAYGSNLNSILSYTVTSEERYYADGSLIVINDPTQFNYVIDAAYGGDLRLIRQDVFFKNILSITVTVTVKDTPGTSQLSVNCFTVFRFTIQKNTLVFVGSDYQTINLCEDIPINSQIYILNAFDSTFSGQPICYSIIDNQYFDLANSANPQNGAVNLINILDYENFIANNLTPTINFTAKAYFCNNPNSFITQVVSARILNVNEYGPKLQPQVDHTLILSLNNNLNFQTNRLNVIDYDAYPFNQFQCRVKDNNLFNVLKSSNNDIIISYNGLQQQLYTEFVDIAVQCCDDLTGLSVNDYACAPISKCTMTPVRIQFTNYTIPVYCANNNQVVYISENLSPSSLISQVSCVSNNTKKAITYQLIGPQTFFSVNSANGLVSLNQSLKNIGLTTQQLKVLCSNGLASDTCNLQVNVVSGNDTRPIWIVPNIYSNCTSIPEDTPIGTSILTIQAVLQQSLQGTLMNYYFAFNNTLISSIYEFQFVDTFSGVISLRTPLNRTVSKLRELTLAASIATSPTKGIISYQYLCIIITPPSNFQPCFKQISTQTTLPYKIYLDNIVNNCFYSSPIRAFNIDPSDYALYSYYFFNPPNKPYNVIQSYFSIDSLTGSLCAKTSVTNIINSIFNSSNSYLDELGNYCYDLTLYVSKYSILTSNQLKQIIYDKYNCSFTTLSICFSRKMRNTTAPSFLNRKCESVISLNKISPIKSKCINRFNLDSQSSNTGYLTSNDNVFGVDNQTNCLYIKKLSQLASAQCPYISLNVSLYTQYNNYYYINDWLLCSVYVTKVCEEEIYILTRNDVKFVMEHIEAYTSALTYLLTTLYRREIIAIVHSVNYRPNIPSQDSDIQASKSFLLVSFFDSYYCRFLQSEEVLQLVNPTLSTYYDVNKLYFIKLISSCLVTKTKSAADIIAVIVLWAVFLALLLPILILLLCMLCYIFKKLKYKNDKILLREQVIPILTTGAPITSIPVTPILSHVSTPIVPVVNITEPKVTIRETVQPILTASPKRSRLGDQSQKRVHNVTQREEIIEEIIEEPELKERYVYKAIDYGRDNMPRGMLVESENFTTLHNVTFEGGIIDNAANNMMAFETADGRIIQASGVTQEHLISNMGGFEMASGGVAKQDVRGYKHGNSVAVFEAASSAAGGGMTNDIRGYNVGSGFETLLLRSADLIQQGENMINESRMRPNRQEINENETIIQEESVHKRSY